MRLLHPLRWFRFNFRSMCGLVVAVLMMVCLFGVAVAVVVVVFMRVRVVVLMRMVVSARFLVIVIAVMIMIIVGLMVVRFTCWSPVVLMSMAMI